MRDAFFESLAELAARDERVWALTGDLGIGLFDPVAEAAPGRVMNLGIAEQALVGVAAGLSYAGKLPFAYSIAPFVTSRPHDQVRVDVAMAAANVKLVGVGGGMSYGYLGPTHHAIEDLALMRSMPNMTVLTPGCWATQASAAWAGVTSIGKNGEPRLLDEIAPVGRANVVREGADVTLASTGAILAETLSAADLLAADGIDAMVLHYGTLKPFDGDALADAAAITGALVTVEEHSVNGGLGSAAAETLAERGAGATLRRIGLQDEFAFAVGSREHLLRRYGLAAADVAAAARELVRPTAAVSS